MLLTNHKNINLRIFCLWIHTKPSINWSEKVHIGSILTSGCDIEWHNKEYPQMEKIIKFQVAPVSMWKIFK